MLFWTIILLLTAAAVMSVLLPLGRAGSAAMRGSAGTQAVYLGQLAELEKDKADGRISGDDAEAARAEIGRRLIALDREGGASRPAPAGPASRRAASLVALCGIPLLSLSIYLALGAPTLPGQPLAARLEAQSGEPDMARLVRQVEEHLAGAPEDGQGWDVIAPVYQRLGRADDAVRAYRNAARLLGSTAARESGLGEAIVATQGGIVTAEAREAFARALAADAAAVSPRFYLAMAKQQEGRSAEAASDLRTLLADAPPDAPWRSMVEQSLSGMASTAPGPSSEEIAAAAAMAEPERRAMIEGMVDGLAERLSREPGDVEGWLRLVRAYDVLGRRDAASQAAGSALDSLPGAADRERVGALAADLGLDVGGSQTP